MEARVIITLAMVMTLTSSAWAANSEPGDVDPALLDFPAAPLVPAVPFSGFFGSNPLFQQRPFFPPAPLPQLCPYGQVSRRVASCPTCRPIRQCINPQQVPFAADQVCRQTFFAPQAVLFRARFGRTRALRCAANLPGLPRGGCPARAFCVPTQQRNCGLTVGVCCGRCVGRFCQGPRRAF